VMYDPFFFHSTLTVIYVPEVLWMVYSSLFVSIWKFIARFYTTHIQMYYNFVVVFVWVCFSSGDTERNGRSSAELWHCVCDERCDYSLQWKSQSLSWIQVTEVWYWESALQFICNLIIHINK
jgi:hypothetical protein